MIVSLALSEANVNRTDAEILLSAVMNKERTWLLAHPEASIPDPELHAFAACIQRRRGGEPVAYIVGRKDFFGRTFFVDPSVLIPRPSTESLVTKALDILDGKQIAGSETVEEGIAIWAEIHGNAAGVRCIADIGTGSGCVGITLALERPDIHVIATDISAAALAVARHNAQHHGVADRMTFVVGSGFDPLEREGERFLLVSNPPYIPESVPVDRGVRDFEPHAALFAGDRGTDVLEQLVKNARMSARCIGFVVECRKEQVELLA